MKRSLVLTLVLSLAATLVYTAVGSAQSTLVDINRAKPRMTSAVTPKRDRLLPYVFTTRGRIIPPTTYCAPGQLTGTGAAACLPILCPPGVTDVRYCLLPGRSIICRGVVNVRVQKRGATISSRDVNLRSDCTYLSRVTFRTRLPARIGSLSFRASFKGNVVLDPAVASTKIARAG